MSDLIIAAINSDDAPSIYAELRDLVGEAATAKIVKHFGGSHVYFPGARWVSRTARNAQMRSEFTGDNIRELARRYSLSLRHARNIITGK